VKVEKEKIRMHFARAAESYDRQAVVQLQTADHLLKIIEKKLQNHPDSILEIGCCTGYFTRCIIRAFSRLKVLHINDLVTELPVDTASLSLPAELKFLAGDIEIIPLPRRYQLICSSSTFHWLHDLTIFFKKIYNHLQPGGMLAFSLYGPDNLREIRELTGNGLDYLSLARVKDLLAETMEVVSAQESIASVYFYDPLTVLEHLRATGVNSLAKSGWSRKKQRSFCREYQRRFGSDKGVTLTYHPMYFVAVKPHI